MKKILFSVMTVFWLTLATPVLAQAPSCIPDLYGNMTCPPPNGGMTTDMSGKTVCGPGNCARDSRGRVRCSRLPGGLVVIDSSGNVLCVGGCEDAAENKCMRPTP